MRRGRRLRRLPPLLDLLRRYTDAGGHTYVCPIWFDAKKLDKGDLLAIAELGGTVPMVELDRRRAPRPSATDRGTATIG